MKKFFLMSFFAYILLTSVAFANPVVTIPPITILPLDDLTRVRNIVIISMILTGILETYCLWCFGYKRREVLTYFFILNLLSNYAVNILYTQQHYGIIVLEISAICFESLALGLLTKYSWKLFWDVTKTNIISFVVGVIVCLICVITGYF